MKKEQPYSRQKLDEIGHVVGMENCELMIEGGFIMNQFCYTVSEETRRLKHRYLIYRDKMPVDVNWKNVHGKHRKLLKYTLRKTAKLVNAQYAVWNRYAGRADILYIHARIGGGNWPYYRGEVENKPWFLEKIDDAFDSTYCDIYAQMKTTEEVRPV